MPPTVRSENSGEEREKRSRVTGERRSDLVCRVKYCNTLPDIPFDPKFINYPFSSNRYVEYKPTSLEKNYKYEVLTEHDLGVVIDLINPDAYAVDPSAELHPMDEGLLEDDVLMPQDAKRSRHHHVNVSWLRRTEYISTEMTRYQPQTQEKIEATVGFAARRKAKNVEENLYTDRDSQLEAIEKTFVDVKIKEDTHYSKPGVTAVEELDIFPDFELWRYPCAQVIFDSDPAPTGMSVPAQIEEMSQAMIRGVMDESGEQFVAYFLPTPETLLKRKRDKDEQVEYMEEDEYDYTMAREYNWNVKNKASKGYEENYFFVIRPDGVYYNELETRVRLSKRRTRQDKKNTSRLVVTHRPLHANEHRSQRNREKMLEPPGDEEEEEEEMEEEEVLPEGEDIESVASASPRASRSRSRSGSRSRSRSKSGSRSRSRSRSKSKTSDRSASSHSRSRSRSRSKSQESNRERSRSPRSRSRSKSQTPTKQRSASRSQSRSKSRSKSRTPTRHRSASHSQSRSRSRSKSQTPTRERSVSRSQSRSRSKSQTPTRERSASHSQSRSRSRSKSPGSSRAGSASRSRSRSRSLTPKSEGSPKSGASSPARSERSRSRSSTPKSAGSAPSRGSSPAESARSRSRSRSSTPKSGDSARSRDSSPAESERSVASASSSKRSRSSSPGSVASSSSKRSRT